MHVPLEKVNIADWLLTLPDAEYQRCSHAHIAAGTSTTDDGRTMSINVETIGDALMEWTLSARKIDDQTTEYTNHIHASATNEFIAFIQEHGITLEQAAAARQTASEGAQPGRNAQLRCQHRRHALRQA